MYALFKTIHIVGIVILVGNVTITAYWKVLADRSGDVHLIAHAQHGVTIADWIFTLAGIVLVLAGGYGAALISDLPLLNGPAWLAIGQMLFAVSGLIWIGILIPLQIRQARDARLAEVGGSLPERYRRDCRLWLIWGIIATVPLVAAIYVMVAKPQTLAEAASDLPSPSAAGLPPASP
jgi:uncharacterized membrane protein